MKRSEINHIMRSANEFIQSRGFYLPPFAYWTPADWKSKGPEVSEIVENKLGWDITDFGSGDFKKNGLFLFTIRNGHPENWMKKSGKLYAEKVMVVDEDQVTPMHFHWNKMEDIINRGGGRLMFQLYNATPEEDLDRDHDVHVSVDGVQRVYSPGTKFGLEPGESLSLPQRLYHTFWSEGGRSLVGEVSLVNDDDKDNRFRPQLGRFPVIEEDEAPLYLLVNDYSRYYSHSAREAV
jgi:D-lyxose ketol-isomerase